MQSRRKPKQSAGRHGESFWEEEKSSFGLKMMKQMGWNLGQGLGKGENGATKFVRARQKKDNGGIGSEKGGQDSSWIATQGLFNDLLTRLNQEQDEDFDPCAEPEETEQTKTTSQALKTFIAKRTLDKRFKKSKDVKGYSSKDMAEIFGRQTEPKKVEPKREVPMLDSNLKTTTSNVSMKDYFAKKLAAGGNKPVSRFQSASGHGFTENQQESYYNASMSASNTGKRGLGFGGGGGWGQVDRSLVASAFSPGSLAPSAPQTQTTTQTTTPVADDAASGKKSKKSKKNKKEKAAIPPPPPPAAETKSSKKKKKKRKREESAAVAVAAVPEPKKKKKKTKEGSAVTPPVAVAPVTKVKKSKKKKKTKD